MASPRNPDVDRPEKKRPPYKFQADDPRDDLRDRIAKQRGRLREFAMRQALRNGPSLRAH